ncbi:unnamed protein product [Microthlaspi erraticum]|uniref:Uncharacterized protein n=1 Tax=Microthlaspi erraticum TaxID=1685480 RepID=A0A6D2JK65_9BRAS|nr:unnamed protein product [Microthlaspi erraticum]
MNKVSQWVDKKVGYIHNLEKNLATLEANMADLKAKRNDLLRKATREEEDRGRQKLEEFQVWLSKVEFLENRVDGLLDARDDIWEKVDLTEIGVPFPAPENRCKVASPLVAETYARPCHARQRFKNGAKDVLSSYATEFSGMEDKILLLLKYSYDNLKAEDVKSYGSKGIERAVNKGYEIIGDLVRASLLMEEAEKDGTRRVRMHDVVREMALWIASELGREKEAFIVHAGVGLSEIPKVRIGAL